MKKRSIREQTFDLFAPALRDLALKDQREVMERPFFSLSKRKRLKPIEYTSPDGDVWVHVSANPEFGIATIWDADILIWATSYLNKMRESGSNEIPRTIRTTPYDLLKAIGRDVGGRGYQELQAALQRLEATTIQTSIRASTRKRAQFGWLDQWTLEADLNTGAPRGMTITLSNWVYEGLLRERALLTLNPDYFAISGGLERAIYRIARKHAGDQETGWTCRMQILHEKTGSESPLKQFSYLVKKIVKANNLPDYNIQLVTAADGSLAVHFIRHSASERARIRAEMNETERRRDRIVAEDKRTSEVDAMMARRRVHPRGNSD